MKRYLVAGTACFATAVLVSVTAAAPGALKRAEELFRRADYERARRELAADTASFDRTSLGEAMLMLARLETDFVKAEALYRRAMASEDERCAQRARLEIAKMRYASGDYSGALETLSAQPPRGSERERSEVLYFTALARVQLGDNARASAEFEHVTRGEYASWSILARAGIDAQAGRISPAIEKYEGLERSKSNPVALFRLGECYEALGQRDEALDRYRSLTERFPRSLEATKGKEKIQLLSQIREKPREAHPAGGGESGEARTTDMKTAVAAGRGFTIQFGSFSTSGNALTVSGKLAKSFRGVRVESVEIEGRIWHRVRAGFYETREAAEKDAARAKNDLGLTGAVVPLK